MNEVFDRIESTLRRAARGTAWHDQRVPAAAMIELMEHTAALLRQIGSSADADRLDMIRRDFLAGTGNGLLQAGTPPIP